MNLIDCYVTKVLSEPFEEWGKWWVEVEYNSYGRLSRTTVMCSSKEQALTIGVDYCFQG